MEMILKTSASSQGSNKTCADPEGGGKLENHKNIEFLSNTGPDP